MRKILFTLAMLWAMGASAQVEMELSGIAAKPVLGQSYKIGQLTAVYSLEKGENTLIFVKDDEASIASTSMLAGQVDYINQVKSLQGGTNAQNNWAMLIINTELLGENHITEGTVLQDIVGTLTDTLNVTLQLSQAPTVTTEKATVTLAHFIGANFMIANTNLGDNTGATYTKGDQSINYYFINPKSNQVAQLYWMVWDGTNFVVPTTEAGINEANLDGGVAPYWDYCQMPDLVKDKMYQFKALIQINPDAIENGRFWRYGDGSKIVIVDDDEEDSDTTALAPRHVSARSGATISPDFRIYPLSFPDNQPTAVTEIQPARTATQVTYYNLAGIAQAAPHKGINIVVTRYSDGSMTATRVLR